MDARQLRWAAGWRAAELQVFRVFLIAKRSGKREPSNRARVSARLKPCPSDCGIHRVLLRSNARKPCPSDCGILTYWPRRAGPERMAPGWLLPGRELPLREGEP